MKDNLTSADPLSYTTNGSVEGIYHSWDRRDGMRDEGWNEGWNEGEGQNEGEGWNEGWNDGENDD